MKTFDSTPQQPINKATNIQSPYNMLNNYSGFESQNTQNPPQDQSVPIFMPIIYNPQLIDPNQNLQQPILNGTLQTEIKNLPFNEQKEELLKILGLLFVSSILEYFFLFGLMALLFEIVDSIARVMFPISLIALLAVAKLGADKKLHPIIVYILLAELTPQTLMFFSRSFDHTRPPHEDGLYFTTADIVFMEIFAQIGVNGLVTLSSLVYLFIENKKIQYLPVLILLFFCTIIAIIVFWLFFVLGLVAMLYAILLLNSLIQISKGRFNLQKNNVLLNTISVQFAILVPLNTSE